MMVMIILLMGVINVNFNVKKNVHIAKEVNVMSVKLITF